MQMNNQQSIIPTKTVITHSVLMVFHGREACHSSPTTRYCATFAIFQLSISLLTPAMQQRNPTLLSCIPYKGHSGQRFHPCRSADTECKCTQSQAKSILHQKLSEGLTNAASLLWSPPEDCGQSAAGQG